MGDVLFPEVFRRRLRQASLTVQRRCGLRREHTKIPSPPAFDTAAAISAYPTHIIPPWTIGFDIPRAVVKSVVIGIVGKRCNGEFGYTTKTCDRQFRQWRIKRICNVFALFVL